MPILIVGANGAMGSALVDHSRWLGATVICVDLHNVKDLPQLAETVDVAFIATPVSEISNTIEILARAMDPCSLIVSFGSVAEPVAPNQIDFDLMKRCGITFCLFHLMTRPIIPLRQTIFGQNVALAIEGNDAEKWKKWLMDKFEAFGPIFHELNRLEHDQVTSISQLPHFLIADLISRVWNETDSKAVNLGLKAGGFPCQSLSRSVLRSTQTPSLVAEILKNHPLTPRVIKIMRDELDKIEMAINTGDPTQIIQNMRQARLTIEDRLLESINWTADRLIHFEADMQKARVIFEFAAEMNKPGLLAKVLDEFDKLNINKTSTLAHNKPNGGCIIIIGVESIDRRVEQAKASILSWTI